MMVELLFLYATHCLIKLKICAKLYENTPIIASHGQEILPMDVQPDRQEHIYLPKLVVWGH